MLRNYAGALFTDWVKTDFDVVFSLLEKNPQAQLLDLGCGDGKITLKFAKVVKTKDVTGLEGLKTKIKGVKIVKGDLNQPLPFPSNSFDVLISHFSFEHLYNTGVFLRETKRILKKGGYLVVATDNLSSWPNVIALLLGWQPFSTTMGVTNKALGNPLALRAGGLIDSVIDTNWRTMGEYSHNKVMAYQMIKDAFNEFGFVTEKLVGVGYFPFSGWLSKLFCKIDPRHAHFIVLKVRNLN